jgi:hypothetical protein
VYEDGFGPVVKGLQLGAPLDFNKILTAAQNEKGAEANISGNNGEMKIIWDSEKKEWRMEKVEAYGKDASGPFAAIISDQLTLGELPKRVAAAAGGKDIRIGADGLGAEHIIYGVNNIVFIEFSASGSKGESRLPRIASLTFSKSAFGAESMPFEDFVQNLVNNYPLGTLTGSVRNGYTSYTSDPSANYQNGWSAAVDSESFKLIARDMQGQTSFN